MATATKEPTLRALASALAKATATVEKQASAIKELKAQVSSLTKTTASTDKKVAKLLPAKTPRAPKATAVERPTKTVKVARKTRAATDENGSSLPVVPRVPSARKIKAATVDGTKIVRRRRAKNDE